MTKQEEAIQFIQEQKYEDAAKLMIEIIEEDPKDPVAYINFGNLLIKMRQFEEAERFLLKAIEIEEKTATAYYSLGNLYYERSLFTDAEKMFQHAIRLGLDDSDAFFMLGMTYVQKGDHQLAIPYLQRASELDTDVEKLFQYGLALAQANFLTEAETILLKVTKENEDHADGFYNLGVIEVHRNNEETAITYFDRALAAQADHQLAELAKRNLKKS